MAIKQNKQLNVSKLDFEDIKSNLKEFLRSQDTLRDYNFEGSALSTFVDLMAYVTHYNAFNANIGINETFLETAQNRGSVVGHARQLGYTPRSRIGSTGKIDIVVNSPISLSMTLPKYARFKSVIDGVSYFFVTTKSYTTTNAQFTDVEIKQGVVKNVEYIYDLDTSEQFIIPDLNVDTTLLEVNVRESLGSSNLFTFVPVKNIVGITGDSRAYFLNETFEGNYEITFGDGVIGRSLVNGNVIEILYLVTDGPEANNAKGFTKVDSIAGNDNLSITTLTASTGGLLRETINTVKLRAPLTFAAQNRAVTPDDYKSIILDNFSNVKSIVVWGGEDNDPPQYGKAFISIKPAVGEILSTAEKDTIINSIIKPKAVVSITPEFIDPIYTYVDLEVFYKYDPVETTLSVAQLTTKVKTAIQNYNDSNLEMFDGVLRYSTLLGVVDNSDNSILNSVVRVYMKKRFIPILNQARLYELKFSSPIYITSSNEPVIYRSSIFTYGEEQCTLQDYINSQGERVIRVIRGRGVNQITVADEVGYVDARAGKIVLTNFNVSSFIGTYIELTLIPDSNDVSPLRNNLVSIDYQNISVTGTSDNVVAGSAAGGSNYTLVSRHA
jgi:YHS domain-containing protein